MTQVLIFQFDESSPQGERIPRTAEHLHIHRVGVSGDEDRGVTQVALAVRPEGFPARVERVELGRVLRRLESRSPSVLEQRADEESAGGEGKTRQTHGFTFGFPSGDFVPGLVHLLLRFGLDDDENCVYSSFELHIVELFVELSRNSRDISTGKFNRKFFC